MKTLKLTLTSLLILCLALTSLSGCSAGQVNSSESARAAGDILPIIKTAYLNSGRCEKGTELSDISIASNNGEPIGPFGDNNNIYVAIFHVEGSNYEAAVTEIKLGKATVTLPNGNTPLAWDGDSFIDLEYAYNSELINDSDAEEIASILNG